MDDKNRFSFTQQRLAKLQPPETGRRYVHDTQTSGLILCVTAAGSKTFYSLRRIGGRAGRTVRVMLGKFPPMTVDDARKAAVAVIGDIANGKDPQAERQSRRHEQTIAGLWGFWLTHAKTRKRTWQEDERLYGKFLSRGQDAGCR